jgi:hypothetical protein
VEWALNRLAARGVWAALERAGCEFWPPPKVLGGYKRPHGYAAQEHLQPQEVEAFLDRQGGKATLEKYFPCDKVEGTAYAEIADGSRRWAAVAVKMLNYSDACYTESILSALGTAMERNPRNILPYVGTSLTLDTSICLPFISDELPLREQLRQIRTAKNAISRVHNAKLSKQRKACLEYIGFAEHGVTAKQQQPK